MKTRINQSLVLCLMGSTLAACGGSATSGDSGASGLSQVVKASVTCYAAWNSATPYNGGAQVSYNGVNYVANWWTQGNNPATNNGGTGTGQPWTITGSCGTATPTPTPSPTPTPVPTPTPTPAPTPTPTPAPTPTPTPTPTPAGVVSGAVYTLVNPNSGKALDVTAAGTANSTAVDIYTVNGTAAQNWQINSNGNGTYSLVNPNSGKDLDVVAAGTANGTAVDIYTANGTGAQQWQINGNSDGTVTLINPASGKALDVAAAGTADGTAVDIYASNASAAQKWKLNLVSSPTTNPFGPNVKIFDPSMTSAAIQSQLDSVYSQQQSNQFGTNRYALLFKPGSYNVNVNVGFYTQVLGLGALPDSTSITGTVQADAQWDGGNATQNFWRSAENLALTPTGGTSMWAVSQASPMRRMHIKGSLVLSDNGGWSSGGFLGDSLIDNQVNSGTQQQWLSRNSQWGSWTGSNWNLVFVGDNNAPASSFPSPAYTTVATTPLVREKPFLTVDSSGNYSVFLPSLRTNSAGTSWQGGSAAGQSLPLSQFYIAQSSSDTAASINAALAAGKSLIFTPGVYLLNDTLRVTKANTVVLGLGLATLQPTTGLTAMTVADVDGVEIAGILFDAGATNSPILLQVGPTGSTATHATSPTALHDLFFRVGGAAVGKATVSLQINSSNVIGDDFWIWRADHTNGVGWTSNTAQNGIVVNGNNVTIYGLAVEHYQQYQTLWNGNGGQVYFYQSEAPYDVPSQSAWMDGSVNGYASYKVANSVTSHQAYGVGIYCYFSTNSSVQLANAIEVPASGLNGTMFHNMTTVSLGGVGQISSIINGYGAAANSSHNVSTLVK